MLDTLFTNARIVDVFRLRTFSGWFGVRGGRFLFVVEGAPPAGLAAKQTVDLGGDFVAPGLIDAHMHIESSLLTPRRFAEAVQRFVHDVLPLDVPVDEVHARMDAEFRALTPRKTA